MNQNGGSDARNPNRVHSKQHIVTRHSNTWIVRYSRSITIPRCSRTKRNPPLISIHSMRIRSESNE